jgi:broad specificity phosphatase PhoE
MPVLYFVRHGETDFNIAHRLQGRYETMLNARGRAQATYCAGVLVDLFAREQRKPADYAYASSPLKRARETMEIMRAALGLEAAAYAVDDRLQEISYGDWEGSTLPEISARDPQLLATREQDKWGFRPPGGESYRDVAARVAAWYATVTRDTVIAAHGGVARALMANFGILPQEEASYAETRHGAVYVFADGTMARYT